METQFGTLGPLRVVDSDGASIPLGGAKTRALLAVLLINHGQTLSVDRLVDHLWGDAASAGSPITLRTYVGQVRQVLSATGLAAVLENRAGGYRIDVPPEHLDFELFERKINRGRELAGLGRYREATAILTAGLSLWRDEALSDLDEPDFARAWQARLDELRLTAWEQLIDCQLATGRHQDVVGQLQDLVARHPYRERLACQLVLALYRCQRQKEALEVAASTKRRFADELGLDVGPELRELEQSVLRQDTLLDHHDVALGAQHAALDDVSEDTTFVGRDTDLSALRRFVTRSRLITLTGFGGVGKTRLASRLAADLRGTMTNEVYFVSLSELSQEAGVAEQVAGALGLEGSSGPSVTESVVAYLGDRSAVVILDNCEHVVDSVARLADRILMTSPRIRIIATSREPLRIAEEVIYPVRPLTTPDPDVVAWDRVEAYDSVRLFLDRAAQFANPDFELDATTQRAISDICRQLEGIPLALELAAARLRTVSAVELNEQLSDQWRGLSRGKRTAPARQSTMSACIDWSFGLCNEAEQVMWAKASIFVDGFDIESVSAVCFDTEAEQDVHDLLAALVDKSVVTVERTSAMTRYRLLPPIREKGLAELDRLNRTAELRSRHCDYFADLATRFHRERFGRNQVTWLRRLRRDFGNISAAIEYCGAEPSKAETGAHMVADLLVFICYEGCYRQCRSWVEQLGAHADATSAMGSALAVAAWCACLQGDVRSAEDLLKRCQGVMAARGEEHRAELPLTEGLLATFTGDLPRADAAFGVALDGFERAGDAYGVSHTFSTMAMSRAFAGDPVRALEAYRSCMDLIHPDEAWLRSWTLWAAGVATWQLGQTADAVAKLRQGLELRRLTAERLGLATTFEALGCLLSETEPELAALLLGAADAEFEKSDTNHEAMAGLGTFHQAALASIETAMGADGLAEAWRRGRSLGQADAISVALGERQGPGPQVASPAPPGPQGPGGATGDLL